MAFNSANTAIKEAYKRLAQVPKSGVTGIRGIPMWKGVGGVISQSSGLEVVTQPGGSLDFPYATKATMEALAAKIQQVYVGSDHLTVKDNTDWKRMYQVGNRTMNRMATDGSVGNYSMQAVPCHNCGLITPFSGIQVDHAMPQKDGNYVLKVFRALGLTVAGASGAKGTAMAGTGLGTLVMNPKGRAPGDYDHLEFGTAANKWTTNDKGTALLSLFMLADAFDDLSRFCMNSLLNLVPLCRACNGTKSDWVRPIE
jgi:hypothetical protein